MAEKDRLFAFLLGYCLSDCIEKDVAVKPLICTIVCGIGAAYGAKITYEGASIIYDKSIKRSIN